MGFFDFLFPFTSGLSSWENPGEGNENPLFGEHGLFSNPTSAWDNFKNGATNETNERIAQQNLEYQRERNAIEDERYKEETAYNRAFAENERDYQRALQQEIFNREDTAIERQANQLSKLGINPLSQQMSGLDSGAVVSASSAPSASSRGGQALHNDFQMQDKGLFDLISPIMSLANGINNINTQGFQRDKLREEADFQRLKNQEQALLNERLANKLDIEQEQREENLRHSKKNNPNVELNTKASAERNERENVFQHEFGVTDNTSNIVRIATDTAKQAERASDYVSDKVGDISKSATNTLANRAKQALDAYNRTTKKWQDGIVNGFKKVSDWYKSRPKKNTRTNFGTNNWR